MNISQLKAQVFKLYMYLIFVTIKTTDGQKVKLAAQLFSHTTANAIEIDNAIVSAEFIQLIND